jgi:hypothetical protein
VKQLVNSSDVLEYNRAAVTTNRVRLTNKQKRLALIDVAIMSQKNYQIPFIIQAVLVQRINSINSQVLTKVHFVNILKHAELSHKLMDLKKFIYETPLIKGNIKSVYHILDMITVVDLISLKICGGELMGRLIGKVLERSSKKGLFVRSLRILSKLPALIKKFEIKGPLINTRSWD